MTVGRSSGWKNLVAILLAAAIALPFALADAPSASAAPPGGSGGGNPSATLSQCANDPAPSPSTDGCASSGSDWVNGNLGASKSVYLEGQVIPYRIAFENLTPGTPATVVIEWDTTKGGTHAIDYLTTFNKTVANANPCLGIPIANGDPTCPTTTTPLAIPKDPQVDNAGVPITQPAGVFTFYGASSPTVVGSYGYSQGAGFVGDKSASLTLRFTPTQSNPVLAWGGHISSRIDWSPRNERTAVTISGSPYHTRLISLNGSGGNQDRSLSADAVIFPGSITVTKDIGTSPAGASFPSTASSPLSPTTFNLTPPTTTTQLYSGITTFQTYTVTEGSTANWALTGLGCQVTSPNSGTSSVSGSTATINMKEGENWTCAYTNAKASLTISKTATESSFTAVGDVIHYGITATNSGGTTLSNVTVTDAGAVGLTCNPTIPVSSLAPGASITCTATHTIVQADLDAGHYDNTACVSGSPAAQACNHVDLPAARLTITKTATETSYSAVGDVIHYGITATNSGGAALSNVTITDAGATGLSCNPTIPVASLPAGASITCTATHTIVQADLDAGHYNNTACVSGSPATQACNSVDVPSARLTITKTATETSYSAVGDVIHYAIVATNAGGTTLSNVTVTDAGATGLTCTPPNGSSLTAGASMNCTATHTITQADLDAHHYDNTACVTGSPAAQACNHVDVPSARLTITKTATETSYSAVGDVIHYGITATNSGGTTLTNVTITDPGAAGLTCNPTTPVASLAPGATITCTASHTITSADVTALHYDNTACVTGSPAPQACNHVDVPYAHLTIAKTATETSYSAVGDVIHYGITATNSGGTTLSNVTVTDAGATGLTCTPANGSSLTAGASMNCTATHTITQADLDARHYDNTACVTGSPAAQACNHADVPSARLTITKTATETSYSAVGDVIHYGITATNSGGTTLTNVTITDPGATGLTCTPPNGSSLTAGASMNCTATHTITQADLDAHHYDNTACVTGSPAAQACNHADVPSARLTITKTATETSYSAVGDVIHYGITATNTGGTTLTNVTITDPGATGLTCTPPNGSSLTAGASMNCTATHTITQADLDAHHYDNTACVTGSPAAQACNHADVPSARLTITKTATETSYSAVGDVIHYGITATNSGGTTLTNVTITDPGAAGLTCNPTTPVASLAPGATITCTATHTITQADLDARHYDNTACVTGSPATQVCNHADVPSGRLTITKTATETSYSAVGDVIHYGITATNSGGTTLTNVTITDPGATGLSCNPTIPVASLPAGASITCTASHTITQADLDAHHYDNTACVTGSPAAQACNHADVPSARLTITKTATETSYSAVGDVIHYGITATNSGGTTLTNVTITDPGATGLSCNPTIPVASLPAGASITCTATHTITADDVAAGHYDNTACVTGSPATQACNHVDVPAAVLGLTKTDDLNPAKYNHVGQVVTFTLVARNNGTTTLHNVSVTDTPALTGFSCTPSSPAATLAPGATVSCTGTHTITQEDLNAGSVMDTGKATSTEANAPDAPDTITAMTNPALTITKTADASAVQAGTHIGFTITVSNATGTAAALDVTVTDPLPNPKGAGSGINWVIDSDPDQLCGISGSSPQMLTCSEENLAVGASFTVHVRSSTSAASVGTYYNAASYTSDNAPGGDAHATETVYGECTLGNPMTHQEYPYGTGRSAVTFAESEILRTFGVFGTGTSLRVPLFYNDEHAMTLGAGPTVSLLTTNPGHVSNPNIGSTAATDPSDRPIYPALFLTDITSDPNSFGGDWQQQQPPNNASALPPSDVYGTWKGATISGSTVTPGPDPAKNNWNLGAGSDPVPLVGGALPTNEGYGTEVAWSASSLNLQPGHAYRLEFMVHDGDQNKTGGDAGEACVNVVIPDGNATGDNTRPTPSDVQAPNAGIAGKMQLGDTVVYTFSEAMDPASIIPGWDGSSRDAVVRIKDSGSNDLLQVWNSTNTSQLTLFDVATGGDYSGNMTFGATATKSKLVMSVDRKSITVTLGTPSGNTKTVSSAKTLVWSPSGTATATDAAGNTLVTTPVAESPPPDIDF